MSHIPIPVSSNDKRAKICNRCGGSGEIRKKTLASPKIIVVGCPSCSVSPLKRGTGHLLDIKKIANKEESKKDVQSVFDTMSGKTIVKAVYAEDPAHLVLHFSDGTLYGVAVNIQSGEPVLEPTELEPDESKLEQSKSSNT